MPKTYYQLQKPQYSTKAVSLSNNVIDTSSIFNYTVLVTNAMKIYYNKYKSIQQQDDDDDDDDDDDSI